MSSLRRARALASAVVLTFASVTPAVASAAPAWACGPEGSNITARGGMADSRGTVREKDTGQVVQEMPKGAVNARHWTRKTLLAK